MSENLSGSLSLNPPTRPRSLTAIDGQMLKILTEAGLTWLRTNQQIVNSLNVFPVPDGDTGTNMVLTMQAAWDEIANSPEHNVKMPMRSRTAMMEARNSGVIANLLRLRACRIAGI
jgi:dihydroxyacetone kinase-like predicted kinase